MATVININALDKRSIQDAVSQVTFIKNSIQIGSKDAVKLLTQQAYDSVVNNCVANGLSEFVGSIDWSYNETTNTGTVSSNDEIIIFNELGTGIVGKNDHPDNQLFKGGWKYDVNSHGESGWVYPKKDGTFGRTSGLPAKSMFYNTYMNLKAQVPNTVNIIIGRKLKTSQGKTSMY